MLLAISILIAVACCVREHWGRLRDDDPEWNALLRKWFIRGVIVPSALWAIINLGVSDRFPALVPKIAIAQANDKTWWNFWLGWTLRGAGFVFICWAAVTYTWLMLAVAPQAGRRREFRWFAGVVGVPLFFLAFVIVNRGAWTQLPMALLVLLMPLVHNALNAVQPALAIPMYAVAQGKMNFGKYEDAEQEVIHQLERKENDFNGWMMLAELYATKYQRFEDAAQVVLDICRDPSVTDVEASLACHKLADWQLEIGMNPPAARAALDMLIQRAPNSHVAHMAGLRLKQMPRTREDLLDQKKRRPLRLPALREEFSDPAPADTDTSMSKHEASLEANRLSDRLRADPNDHNARERLAILLAEKLGQVNLGVEQLRLMVKLPGVEAEKAAKWLAQIASWERHLNKNEQKFRALLAEIICLYPNATPAYAARRQLRLIEDQELQKTNPSEKPAASSIRLQVPKS